MERESSSKNKQQQAVDAAASGSKPAAVARPHWRLRDPADTAVYVVQPDQFRAVVQQLTGAASPPPLPADQRQGGHGTAAAAGGGGSGTNTNAALSQQQQQQQHGGGRTLGQIQQECMAWANADDD